VGQIIPAKIKEAGDEVTETSLEESSMIAAPTDPELEPDNERNKAYYEDELDNNPYNCPFEFSTLNPSFHRKLTKDL
jgi:hypothetical protein